ncbi:MAG: carboxypeptidase-like regulatory domain-containing protein [Gammaproteobacteria bacterium]
MKIPNGRWAGVIAFLPLLAWSTLGSAQSDTVPIDADDIGGVVTSADGLEAGVWVIAETDDFATRFARIVVTDDQGRYLVPDLPEADYQLWVRGYGLADSAKVAAERGSIVDLTAIVAPSEAVAAEIYPAAAWYAMMHLPDESELGHVPGGLNEYLSVMKNQSCVGCHQLGNLATRTIPDAFGEFESSADAWVRRVQSGQAAPQMINVLAGRLGGVPIRYLADWTDRVAAGELPTFKPARPQGIERNVVATVRDWGDPKSYLHDLTTTDRRDPTVNGYGKIYGAPELSTDNFPILDPIANTAVTFRAQVRDANTPTTNSAPVVQPSVYWGDERIWDSQANAHNPMFDGKGRVWYTARVRGPSNPDFCRQGSDHPSAQFFPTERANRHLAVYDAETETYTFVDTCFSTHHLQFAEDDNNTLWTSGGNDVVGWLDTNKFDETGDAAASQGWAPLILDTNGNGRRDDYVEPGEPLDPGLDMRISAGFYAVMPNPADGSIWGSTSFSFPGSIIRLDPGTNPPETALAERYNIPLPGFASRGADIDRNGVVWVSLGSGHLGEFDRSKCEGPLNGPTATGDHCPEGWTFHRFPGPGFPELPEYSVESSYYTWVDQRNTSGLGANTPIATANLFDGVHALVDGEFITMRIPYPLGFYSKGFDGRIDDPDAGWKGRGLWVSSGDRTPWLKEGGLGTKPLVVHFQVRPDPLAR